MAADICNIAYRGHDVNHVGLRLRLQCRSRIRSGFCAGFSAGFCAGLSTGLSTGLSAGFNTGFGYRDRVGHRNRDRFGCRFSAHFYDFFKVGFNVQVAADNSIFREIIIVGVFPVDPAEEVPAVLDRVVGHKVADGFAFLHGDGSIVPPVNKEADRIVLFHRLRYDRIGSRRRFRHRLGDWFRYGLRCRGGCRFRGRCRLRHRLWYWFRHRFRCRRRHGFGDFRCRSRLLPCRIFFTGKGIAREHAEDHDERQHERPDPF